MHQKIMEILLSLHEKSSGPLQRVYEICLCSMEHVEGDIKSVAELPQIPFTIPIRRKLEAAIMEPETETETNSPEVAKKRRRTKRSRKPISESESSTSTYFSRHKRSKKATKGSMVSTSTSNSSSESSLPDPSRHRVKCTLCNSWVEKYEMRQHKKGHHDQTNVPTSPSVTRSFRPSRQAKKNSHQIPDFVYY